MTGKEREIKKREKGSRRKETKEREREKTEREREREKEDRTRKRERERRQNEKEREREREDRTRKRETEDRTKKRKKKKKEVKIYVNLCPPFGQFFFFGKKLLKGRKIFCQKFNELLNKVKGFFGCWFSGRCSAFLSSRHQFNASVLQTYLKM